MSEKSGDSKLHQLVIVLITTIVGPLVVFFVTNGIKNSGTASTPPTITPPAITQPAGATKPAPGGDLPNLPGGVRNPSGVIPAGTPALVDQMALTISAQDLSVDGSYTRLAIHIRNLGSARAALTYTPAAISIKDAAGKVFEPFMGEKKNACDKAKLSASKTVQIDPGAELVLASPAAADASAWCAPDQNSTLPLFITPSKKGAANQVVNINGVGPFKGFSVEVAP